MKRLGRVLWLLGLGLLLTGCKQIQSAWDELSPNQVMNPINQNTDEQISESTTATVPSLTPEVTPPSDTSGQSESYFQIESQFKRLPGGSYLVYYDSGTNSLEALSFQLTTTTIAKSSQLFNFSTNMNFGLVNQTLVELQAGKKISIPEFDSQENCQVTSISRRGEFLLANCENQRIKILPVGQAWVNLLPENLQFKLFSDPILSPDDQQVAFCMQDPENETLIHFYRVDLESCMQGDKCELSLISTKCDEVLSAWSPDAKMIAISDQKQGIHFIEFLYRTKTELLNPLQTGKIDDMFWSPDGKWLAYSRSEGTQQDPKTSIYLFSLAGSEPRMFYQTDHPIKLVGWLNVVSEFKQNNHYAILPGENQYWLKDTPSQDGFNLKLFLPAEKVRVLDKMEIVKGEKWWQVRVGDFTGWVVENNLHFQDDWMYGFQSPVFEQGRRLLVKVSGNDVRLREMPSLSGTVKRYLQPGMKLKIIDGPAVVDKYKWWLVEIEGSGIYGWVVEEALWYAAGD